MASKSAKLRPWPDSTFRLKTAWENWSDVRHFRVHLERRAPGRFGRLEAMHAVVPKRKKPKGVNRLFATAKYRLAMLSAAADLMSKVGVSAEQADSFMAEIHREYTAPTPQALFLEEVEDPLVTLALGGRRDELSYYKTGVAEFTREDLRLIEECTEDLRQRMKTDKALMARFLEIGLGGEGFFP